MKKTIKTETLNNVDIELNYKILKKLFQIGKD
jgi:hypothetical protein